MPTVAVAPLSGPSFTTYQTLTEVFTRRSPSVVAHAEAVQDTCWAQVAEPVISEWCAKAAGANDKMPTTTARANEMPAPIRRRRARRPGWCERRAPVPAGAENPSTMSPRGNEDTAATRPRRRSAATRLGGVSGWAGAGFAWLPSDVATSQSPEDRRLPRSAPGRRRRQPTTERGGRQAGREADHRAHRDRIRAGQTQFLPAWPFPHDECGTAFAFV